MAITPDGFIEHIERMFSSSAAWINVGAWDRTARSMLNRTGEPINDLKWSFSSLGYGERVNLSNQLKSVLGINNADLAEQMGLTDAPFKMRRPVTDVWTQGYGSFTLPPEEFIGRHTSEDILQKLMYITPNVTVSGIDSPDFLMNARYQKKFLEDTAKQVLNAENILKGNTLIFDVETAGLSKDSGIWQLSARMVKGGQIQTEAGDFVKEFLFDNPNMDMGMYGSKGNPMGFKQFYETITKRSNLNWEKDFARSFESFLDMTLQADYIVGQNVAFDIEHITYALNKMDGGVSDQLANKVVQFKEMAKRGKVIDTAIMSEMLFSKDITIDPALQKLNQFTPFSMENIMLRTNFLEELATDLDRSGNDGWGVIDEMLTKGAHHADVDTFFEGHLFKMQLQSLSGARTALRAYSDGTELPVATLAEKIRRASAITPFTRVEEMGGLTPIQRMIQHTRRLGDPLARKMDLGSAPLKAGLFTDWTDDILDEQGRLRSGSSLTDPRYVGDMSRIGRSIQQQAIDAGLPFGGLSSIERLLTTEIGRLSGVPGGEEIRHLMGDVMGTGVVEMQSKYRIFASNVAISPNILREAESQKIISTSFNAAMEGDVTHAQMARWSAIKPKKGNYGLALVADVFQNEGEMENFADWLKSADDELLKKIGLTTDEAADLASNMTENVLRRGVQIGYLGGEGVGAERVVNLMEQLNFGIDSPDYHTLRAAVYAPSEAVQKVLGRDAMMVGATVVGEVNEGEYIENLGRAAELTEEAYTTVAKDRFKINQIKTSKMRPRGFIEKGYDFVKRLNPRNVAIGAAAGLGGYYLWQRDEEQDPYDATMSFQGYETPPPGAVERRKMTPLHTAGMVQGLDANKTRHHQMSANKYDHLF